MKYMKRTAFVFIISIFVSITGLSGQSPSVMPVISKQDIGDAVIKDTRRFSNESLFGYIDGGAELFLEYGFDSLVVTGISYKGNDIRAEIYRMSDPDAAFGIYSVSHFRCTNTTDLTMFYCSSAFQAQFCKGLFYVSIINSNGTAEEQKFSADLASLLISRINGPSFNANTFFTDDLSEQTIKSAVLVRGSLGLFNGAYGLTRELEDFQGYTALIIKGEETQIAVRFNSVELMKNFIQKEQLDADALRRGEEVTDMYGGRVSMICEQSLLLKVK